MFAGYLWNLGSRNANSLNKRKFQVAVALPLFLILTGCSVSRHCIPNENNYSCNIICQAGFMGRGSWWSSLLYPSPLSDVINQEAMNLLVDSLKTCHRQTPTPKYHFWGAAESQVCNNCATPTPFLQCYTPISLPLCLSNSIAGLCASCRFGSHAQEARILRSSF